MKISDRSPVAPEDRAFVWAVAGAAILAAVLATALRGGHSLSGDEPYMANTVRLPWPDLLAVFRTDNVPLPYLLLRAWTSAFGEAELSLRALSTTAFVGAVIATGRAAALAGGWPAGALAALLMATSVKVGLLHAATARPYALLSLMTALAGLEVVQLVTRPDSDTWRLGARTMLRIALVHLAGLFTHPTYVFVFGATTLAAFLRGGSARPVAAWAASLAAAVYLVTWWPTLYATIHSGATSWIAPPVWTDLGSTLELLWGWRPGLVITLTIAALSVMRVDETRRLIGAPPVRAMGVIGIGVLLTPFVVSFSMPMFVPSRMAVLLLPTAAVLIAVMVVRRSARLVPLALGGVVLAAALVLVTRDSRGGDPRPSRASVGLVLSHASCGDTILSAGLSFAVVEYYARQSAAPPCIQFERFPAEMLDYTHRIAQSTTLRLLEAEAEEVAGRVSERPRVVHVFLQTRGSTYEASDMLRRALVARLTCSEPEDLRGSFFNAVMSCR